MMKLSVKGLAFTAAILWGAALLIMGSANMMFPGYATNFLEVIGSVYPGYHPSTGVSSVIIGSIYGAILAWVYNFFAE